MRLRIRRRNFAWLGILAAMIGVAALSGAASAPVIVTLAALFGVAMLASIFDLQVQPDQLVDRSRSSLTAMRMSTEAREASERARRRGGLSDPGLILLDVGLFTSQAGRSGMDLRRTRDVSLDEDGVRPFIQLHVSPRNADKQARIRFEMLDQNGDAQYVHEMRTYLRDGEMNILPDHHLPLGANGRLLPGDWDLRVYVDGNLLAAHNFSLIPSMQDRFGRLQRSASAAADPAVDRRPVQTAAPVPQNHLQTDDRPVQTDDQPLSLEDLLRSRGQNGSQK
ncbi:MAG: hypothetical protein U0670_16910 [Anaerolineae bacterium]